METEWFNNDVVYWSMQINLSLEATVIIIKVKTNEKSDLASG